MVASAPSGLATYAIDPSHSEIEFGIRHMVVSTTKGRFRTFSGEITFDPQNIAASSVKVTIDADSIDTRDAKRDEHLRSNDFFGVGDNPQITFVSSRVVPAGGDKFDVIGDLTIAGITKEVTLSAEFNGVETSPWGSQVVGFSATTELNRKDYGVNWNAALESGGFVVGDRVKISLEVEAMKQ
jgi:polyisoprenoid-binding protein YceI